MIRNFFRHLLESIKSLKRNSWMTLASVSAVTVTLVLVGIFLAVIMNVSKLAEDIEKDVNVSVFVNIGTEQEALDQVKNELQKIDHVEKVTFSSKDEQLKKIQDAMGSAWQLFEEDSNPLYDVYIVSATEPQYTKSIQKEASKLADVYKADYGGLSSEKIFSISNAVQTWGLVGSALLILVAIFLISNTIRVTILSRQREIQIMRLVGARNSFIRGPFFFEGAWIGILGSVVPILLMTFGYTQVYLQLNPELLRSNYSLIPPDSFLWQINLLMLGIGVVIGALGSVISMRRFLKF